MKIKLYIFFLFLFIGVTLFAEQTKKESDFQKSKNNIKINLQKELKGGEKYFEILSELLAQYEYIATTKPLIYIAPQIIAVTNNKIDLTKVRTLKITWYHPENKNRLLQLEADVVSKIQQIEQNKKIWNIIFFGGISNSGLDFSKNLSLIGIFGSILNISGFHLSAGIGISDNISVMLGFGYYLNKAISLELGYCARFGGKQGLYFGLGAKLF